MDAESPQLLLVESHGDTRLLLERLLRGWGWDVVAAAGGRAALREVCRRDVVVAVVDTALSDIDLPAFVRRFRCRTCAPIIATTTAVSNVLDRYRAMPFQQVLLKPYTLDELRDALTFAVAERRACACA